MNKYIITTYELVTCEKEYLVYGEDVEEAITNLKQGLWYNSNILNIKDNKIDLIVNTKKLSDEEYINYTR